MTGLRLDDIRPSNEEAGVQGACLDTLPAYLPRGSQLTGLPCLTGRLPSLDDNAPLYTMHSFYAARALSEARSLRPEAVIYTDVASLQLAEVAVFMGSKFDSTWDSMARYKMRMLKNNVNYI
jgi:hypothetical protein